MADQKEAPEIVKNCSECKKPISRARWYYRNGSYYCNKNCFKKKVSAVASAATDGN